MNWKPYRGASYAQFYYWLMDLCALYDVDKTKVGLEFLTLCRNGVKPYQAAEDMVYKYDMTT